MVPRVTFCCIFMDLKIGFSLSGFTNTLISTTQIVLRKFHCAVPVVVSFSICKNPYMSQKGFPLTTGTEAE